MNARNAILLLALLGALAGCSRIPSAKWLCVSSMQQLWEAARSYHLERGLSEEQLISPRDLTNYLRDAALLCPLGTNQYAAFSYGQGPKCPNSDAHTQALRASRR
jgi:hypothetical protein